MKNQFYYLQGLLYALTIILFGYSCTDEAIDLNSDNSDLFLRNVSSSGITLRNGRLCFTSESSLKEIHEQLTSLDDKGIYDFMKSFYSDDFISLRPILPEEYESEEEVAHQIQDMSSRIEGLELSNLSLAVNTFGIEDSDSNDKYDQIAELIDNTDAIVGDDVFAVLLNYLGEIQVGSTVYRYTDVGRFSISENYQDKIKSTLEDNGVSENPLIPTEYHKRILAENSLMNSVPLQKRGISTSDEDVMFFRPTVIEEDKENIEEPCSKITSSVRSAVVGSRRLEGNAGGISRPISRQPASTEQLGSRRPVSTEQLGLRRPVSTEPVSRQPVDRWGPEGKPGISRRPVSTEPVENIDQEVANCLASLSSCHPSRGLFGNLFGTNKVCKNRYAARRRIKVKAFCYNYGIIYHVGTKVKHQKKGRLGLWRTSKAQYIEMGVEYAQFTYDYSKMINATITNIQKAPRIYYNGKQYIDYMSIGMDKFEVTSFNINKYPTLFKSDIVIEQFGLSFEPLDYAIREAIKGGNNALTSNKLNEYFWTSLWSSTNSFLSATASANINSNKNRTLLAKFAKEGKILIQKSYNSKGYNLGVRSHTFDWGFVIGITANPENNWSLSGDLSGSGMIKPKNFKCSMYGVVKGDDGNFHGVKMSF